MVKKTLFAFKIKPQPDETATISVENNAFVPKRDVYGARRSTIQPPASLQR